MNSNLSKKRSIGSVALFCVILSTVATNAFVHTMTRRPIGVKPPTQLYTSLSTPTGRNFTAFHDDDRADIKKVITKNSIKIIPIHQIDHSEMDATEDSSDFNEFHRHLKRVSFKVRNSKTRAILMDDELKRLETKFYNLTGDDMPTCRLAPSQYSYHGPTYRPDSKCYAMVINAYAKSGHGRTEACLAEEACERFEMFNPESNANSFMMKGILKAWLGVGELEKAEQCLMKMENCYKKTHQFQDAPDMMSYTLFLEALAHCRGDYESQAGSLSLELFHRMRTAYIFGENSHAMPTLRTYLAVMRCQERSYRGIIAVNKIRNVLEQLERDYEVFGRPDTCRPNAQAAMLVISIASKCRGNMQAIRIMETVLQKLQERFEESGELEYRPLDQMYTLLFSAYSKVNAENAPTCSKKVDKFLAMMQKNEMTPSIYATTAAIRAMVNDKTGKNLERAEEMMRNLESPDEVVYQSLIKGYCRNGNAIKADQMLQELENTCGSDVMSMAVCLDAWSKTTDCYDRAIERTERLLDQIIYKYRMGLVGPEEKHVDSWIFEDVARLWSRSRKPGSGDEIIALIRKMEDIHNIVPGYFHPTENLYILALDGVTTTDRHAGQKALALLNEMQNLSRKKVLPSPSLRVLSTVVASLSKSSGRGSVRKACEVYYKILLKYNQGDLKEPLSPRTLSVLFRSILRSTDVESGQIAMDVLRKTSDFARSNPSLVAPNTIVFNTILDGFARKELPDEAWETIELMVSLVKEGFETTPDVISYSCVARALSAAMTPMTLKRTDALVRRVLELYEKGELVPDIQLFNRILIAYKNACSLHEESARRAHDLVIRLENLSTRNTNLAPELLSYRTVCETLSKSKLADSSLMLEQIYLRARALAKEGHIPQLDRELCYAALSSYARNLDEESLEKAESIVEEMELRRHDRRTRAEAPNTRVYNRMLFAYANSGNVNQSTKARKIFTQMKEAYENGDKDSQPNIHSYNSLILAAAKSIQSTNRDEFELALSIFKVLHSEARLPDPNSATYEYFLQACSRLLPIGPVQTKLTQQAFKLCRQRGLVTPLIIRQIFSLIPEIKDELESLPVPSFTTMGDKIASSQQRDVDLIPESWCSGVPEKYRKRKVVLGECY